MYFFAYLSAVEEEMDTMGQRADSGHADDDSDRHREVLPRHPSLTL